MKEGGSSLGVWTSCIYLLCNVYTSFLLIEGEVGQALEDRYTEVSKLRATASGSLS